MPYTLAKFLIWGLILALAGGIIGWALRSLKCRAELARVRAQQVDEEELSRLRNRLANLEPVVSERDRLRMELADVRGQSAGALGFASTRTLESTPEPDSTVAEPSIVPDAEVSDAANSDSNDQVAGFAAVGEQADSDDDAVIEPEDSDAAAVVAAVEPAEAVELDLDAAAGVLGKKIKLDDLTVVEGIGPKIAELCSGIKITTWSELADANVADLQSMLDDAGSRFQMHKPGSWPEQAGLLATGQWDAFKTLTDHLIGGK